MNATLIRASLAAAALVGPIVLAGCSTDDHNMSGMPGTSSSAAPSPSASASGSASTSAVFNNADVMFVQMMIPHHEGAVQMSDTILAKEGLDADIAGLARQIKAAQQPEIDIMTGWLSAWGHSPMPDGHGMDMGGATSEEEMRELEQADGPTGQKLFLESMVKHHQGAIQMAEKEIANGKNPDAIALAKNIRDSQQKEIATMNELLAKL